MPRDSPNYRHPIHDRLRFLSGWLPFLYGYLWRFVQQSSRSHSPSELLIFKKGQQMVTILFCWQAILCIWIVYETLGILDGCSDNFWKFGTCRWPHFCHLHLPRIRHLATFRSGGSNFRSLAIHHPLVLQTARALRANQPRRALFQTNQILARLDWHMANQQEWQWWQPNCSSEY